MIGIELCPEAIENAKRNAHINGTSKINFKKIIVKDPLFIASKAYKIFLVHKFHPSILKKHAEIKEIVLIGHLSMS